MFLEKFRILAKIFRKHVDGFIVVKHLLQKKSLVSDWPVYSPKTAKINRKPYKNANSTSLSYINLYEKSSTKSQVFLEFLMFDNQTVGYIAK
jgi:hypothetical protein